MLRWVDVAVGTSHVKPIPKGVHVEFTKGNELVDAIDRAARSN